MTTLPTRPLLPLAAQPAPMATVVRDGASPQVIPVSQKLGNGDPESLRGGLPVAPPTSTDVDTWKPRLAALAPIELVNLDRGDDAVAEGPVRRRRASTTQLQPRDLQMLRFIARYRYVTYPQLVQRFGIPIASLRRRMPKLQREGLVTSVRGGPTTYTLWRVTEEGAAIAGLLIDPPRKIAWSHVAHTLGLADLGIQFEEAGELVVTEAEIRASDTRAASGRMEKVHAQGHRAITGAPVFAVGASGRDGLHVPDMVLAREENPRFRGQPQSLAIELELTRKAPARIRQVLLAYRKAPNIGAVVYFTLDHLVRNLIEKCAADTHTTDIVDVRRWEPSDAMGLVEG